MRAGSLNWLPRSRVAEAVLAVAGELAGLRGFLGLTMSLTPEARANLPKGVRRGGHHGI